MKRILPYLIALAFTTHVFALTTNELATFLGVDSWESKIGLPRGSFTAQVYEFADGKITKPVTMPFAGPVDETGDTPVSVIWRGVDSSIDLRLALDQDSMAGNPNACARFIGMFLTTAQPPTIQKGDFILGGEPISKNGTYTASSHLEDYKRGLLLRISGKGE